MSAGHTPGPWGWQIEDHSMASLGHLPDPGLGNPLVLAISPCEACQDRADPKEWLWGRCHTPSEANARLIAAAPELLEELEQQADGTSTIISLLKDQPGPVAASLRGMLSIQEQAARAAIAQATGAA